MSTIRNSRTRLLTAAASVALAALTLTACNDGTGVTDEGAAPSASTSAPVAPTASAPSAPSSSGGGAGTGTGTGTGASDSAPASKPTAQNPSAPAAKSPAKPPAPAGKTVTCEGSTTKTVAAPLNRPVNHMLLTVTNTGSSPCHLYAYPAVRFGEAQAVPPVVEESHPQAVVTLAPGESGYAAVLLSAADGSGAHGHTEKSLSVHFFGRSGSGSAGSAATPPLPAQGVFVDDSLRVTYWQQDLDDALTW
ncbi:DUF4232 domain-containing protein [Streptomyces griseosporeus]|uniref:DUF4232 domain-containing protein n=1 Tax=Streptomyces griseosporeus TaxID=1910 RepID=UPI0036B05138